MKGAEPTFLVDSRFLRLFLVEKPVNNVNNSIVEKPGFWGILSVYVNHALWNAVYPMDKPK